jgi:histone H3/H4
MQGRRVSKDSAVFLTAVLEYLTVELIENAGNIAKN